jgi:hypothetical protein
MGRHQTAGDSRADAEAVWTLRGWYDSLPVPPVSTEYAVPACPRCHAQRPIDYGAKIGCGECGYLWRAAVAEPPLSPRERYQARRRLDEAER